MRKAKPKKREVLPDPKYNDKQVTKFVNNIMRRGKKSLAFRIFYKSLDIIAEKMKDENLSPLEIWRKALENVAPVVEVKSRRIGGATFQVPVEVNPFRRESIAMKNLIKYAKMRKGKPMEEKLAEEIMAAYKEEGGAFKKKEEIHRMAEANKAFAHYKV